MEVRLSAPLDTAKILRRTVFGVAGVAELDPMSYLSTQIRLPVLGVNGEEWLMSNHNVTYQEVSSTMKIALTEFECLVKVMLPSEDIRTAAYGAYQQIFAFAKMLYESEFYFARIWNYIPDILVSEDRQRYMLFNEGRKMAWEQFGPKTDSGQLLLPAATGIGAPTGSLVIEALLVRGEVVYLQNPRQVPAHLYSETYGAQPPVFARATAIEDTIFVSGTASIVGEDTRWCGNPVAQALETVRNLQALLSVENLRKYGLPTGLMQCLRVYVKNQSDWWLIHEQVTRAFPGVPVLYLQDEICRPDLLLEIEGVYKLNSSKWI